MPSAKNDACRREEGGGGVRERVMRGGVRMDSDGCWGVEKGVKRVLVWVKVGREGLWFGLVDR